MTLNGYTAVFASLYLPKWRFSASLGYNMSQTINNIRPRILLTINRKSTGSIDELRFVSGSLYTHCCRASPLLQLSFHIHTYIHTYMKFRPITRCIVEVGSNQRRGLLLGGGFRKKWKRSRMFLTCVCMTVGAFLTERGMEFQMKRDDQEKVRWPIVRLVRGIVFYSSRVTFSLSMTDRPLVENFERRYLATGHPIHFVFGSVGFLGSVDWMDLLPVEPNVRGCRRPSWKISKEYNLCNGTRVIRSTFNKKTKGREKGSRQGLKMRLSSFFSRLHPVDVRRSKPLSWHISTLANGKQVKTDKIAQIIPWFPRFYTKKSTDNSQRRYSHMRKQWPLHGDNAYQRRFQAAFNSLTAWKLVVVI